MKNNADLNQLETPCLVLDGRKLRQNISRMHNTIHALHSVLRPHTKTAKNIEVVELARKDEPGGITVSTLKEAEYFFSHGIDDILYAVGIAPGKLDHVADLIKRGADITIILDSLDAAQKIESQPRQVRFPVLIEIDSDGHRSGVDADDPALLEIGTFIHASKTMALRGVMTHAGASYGCDSLEKIAAVAQQEHRSIVKSADKLQRAGLPCPVVSLGSTPTALLAKSLERVTEVRAGVYMFFDLVMLGLNVCRVEEIALSVLCSVIGHQRHKNQVISDAGWMAMSRDSGTASQKIDQGYGLVCDINGVPLKEDLIITSANQEHGIIQKRHGGAIDFDRFPIGTLLRVLPNHACATAAQHDGYYVINGDTEIAHRWPRFGGW